MPRAQSRQAQPALPRRRHLPYHQRDSKLRLASAIAEYVDDVRARRSVRAADQLKQIGNDFCSSSHKRRLRGIKRRDLVAYMAVLRERVGKLVDLAGHVDNREKMV
jgi:hypothetical protein